VSSNEKISDAAKLQLLKDLLLDDDRASVESIRKDVKSLNTELHTKEQLQPNVDPIIEERLERYTTEVPEKLGPAITAALKKQINESRDEVVDLLYPIIGKLIGKFIRIEIEKLSERIDKNLAEAFSYEGWIRRIKGWFTGTSESELLMQELNAPVFVEVMVIEKDSGLLMANYSEGEVIDRDMVAGMLTAIKAFAEDAFSNGEEELEVIQYESYNLHMYNFKAYYVVVVSSGVTNAQFMGHLHDRIMSFAKAYIEIKNQSENAETENTLNFLLKSNFEHE